MAVQNHPARREARVRHPIGRHLPFVREPHRKPNWMLVDISVFLALASLRGPLLIISGQGVEAQVTSVTGSTAVSEYPQSNMIVGYVFTARNGDSYRGTFSPARPASTSSPRVGDPLPVRYLPSFPGLHSADSLGRLAGITVVSIVAAALLVFFGVKRSTDWP